MYLPYNKKPVLKSSEYWRVKWIQESEYGFGDIILEGCRGSSYFLMVQNLALKTFQQLIRLRFWQQNELKNEKSQFTHHRNTCLSWRAVWSSTSSCSRSLLSSASASWAPLFKIDLFLYQIWTRRFKWATRCVFLGLWWQSGLATGGVFFLLVSLVKNHLICLKRKSKTIGRANLAF